MESPGLAYWSQAIADKPKMDEAAYARIAAHPRFSEACVRSAKNWLAHQQGDAFASQMAMDMACVFYCIFTLYLDARGGLTLKGIKDFCAETGQASPGRAAAIMLKLRMMGYVVRDRSPTGTRNRGLVPAPAMQESARHIFRQELLAFSLIEPEALIVASQLDDPEIFRRFMILLGSGFANVARRSETNIFEAFANHNAGIAILYYIATSGQDDDAYPPAGPVRLSVKEIARRFNVSRTHVLRLLRKVESQGLMRRNADEITGVLEEPLREGLKYLHTVTLLGVAACLFLAVQAAEAGD